MTTITHQCRKCGRTYAVSCNDVFYTTVAMQCKLEDILPDDETVGLLAQYNNM